MLHGPTALIYMLVKFVMEPFHFCDAHAYFEYIVVDTDN
jgi:hypothetical protein